MLIMTMWKSYREGSIILIKIENIENKKMHCNEGTIIFVNIHNIENIKNTENIENMK